jgi:hypothetical protein
MSTVDPTGPQYDTTGTGTQSYATTPSTSPAAGDSTKDVARDQAQQVRESAGQQAGQVAQTAKEQAQDVAAEAQAQARNLAGELRTQVDEQAGTQRDRLVETLRSVGDELEQMVSGGGSRDGIAGSVASQLATRAHDIAGSLDGREPGDLVADLQAYARRRPGAFLLGAAVAGVVAGRLTRGAKQAHDDRSEAAAPAGATYGTSAVSTAPVPGAVGDDLGATPTGATPTGAAGAGYGGPPVTTVPPAAASRGASATPLAETGAAPADVADVDVASVDVEGERRVGYTSGPGL